MFYLMPLNDCAEEGMPESGEAQEKLNRLKEVLGERRPVISYSGGTDSSFLAYVAKLACDRYLAVTLLSPLTPSWEREASSATAEEVGLRHRLIHVDLLAIPQIASNQADRCYHCKRFIMSLLKDLAREEGYDSVMDGTNHDDLGQDRPGLRALAELGVETPLADLGFTKEEIRMLSRDLGIPSWNRPSSPCIATRIPHGQSLEPERLQRVDRSERILREDGFSIVRVRDHGATAVVELGREELDSLDLDRFRNELVPELKGTGYRNVLLDLEPYGHRDD